MLPEDFWFRYFCAYLGEESIDLSNEQVSNDLLSLYTGGNTTEGYDYATFMRNITLFMAYSNSPVTGQQLNPYTTFLDTSYYTGLDTYQDQVVSQLTENSPRLVTQDTNFLFNPYMQISNIFQIPPEEVFSLLFPSSSSNVITEYPVGSILQNITNEQISRDTFYGVEILTFNDMPFLPDASLESRYVEYIRPTSSNTKNKKISCNFPGCKNVYGRIQELKRHYNTVHSPSKKNICKFCNRNFTRPDALKRHQYLERDKNIGGKLRYCKGFNLKNRA